MTTTTDPGTPLAAAPAADPADAPTIPIPTTAPAADDQAPAEPPAPEGDAPAADEKTPGKLAAAASNLGVGITGWWAFIREPMSLAEAWRESGRIDARRIPAESHLLAALWWWSNRTDRVLLFACFFFLPLPMSGPILWCAVRPTRRWALYAIVFFLWVILPAIVGS